MCQNELLEPMKVCVYVHIVKLVVTLALCVLCVFIQRNKRLVVLKVVEIAPASQLDPHLRDRLHADAVNLARQVWLCFFTSQ